LSNQQNSYVARITQW